MARSKRTLLSALLSIGLIAGLLAVTQIPASAQTTPSSLSQFLPNDTNWGGTNVDPGVLSDRPDGQDTAAHLTTVATSDTDRVIWYVCPNTINYGDGFTQTELASCETIGTDAEPRTATATRPAGSAQIDEAYDITWNITQAQEGIRDIVALGCIGTGERIEGSNQNCIFDVEIDINVDNADQEDASTATTSGEFLSYSTANGTPPAASTFVPFPHGSTVPNDGFYFNATTSPDFNTTNGDMLGWAIDQTITGANDEPDSADATGTCTQVGNNLSATNWQCNVPNAAVADNQEMAIAIYDANATGNGFCAGANANCAFDIHYIVASQRGTVTAVHSFVNASSGSGAQPCTTPDKTETNLTDGQQRSDGNRNNGTPPSGANSGNEERVRGCLVDRFGQLQGSATAVTFELSGLATAGYVSCDDGNGTLHDHDGNGYFEHCHATTGVTGNGRADAVLDNYGLTGPNTQGQTGTATSRFCVDPQNDQGQFDSTQTSPVGHGCGDEAAASQDTITKNYGSAPTHVHLVFAGTGDSTNPCHTGDQFKENDIGDRDTLTACTMDAQDRPSTTAQTGGGRLQWTLFPSTSGQQTATRFDCTSTQGQCPPSETDANGQASVVIEAINEGTDQICVDLHADAGTAGSVSQSCVQKRVRRAAETPTTTPPPSEPVVRFHDRSVTINFDPPGGKKGGLTVFGEVNSNLNDCVSEVPVKVQRRFNGRWVTRKETTTTENGRYAVEIRNLSSRYRAIASKYEVSQPDGSIDVCRKARKGKRYNKPGRG